MANHPPSFLWYDLETFGARPRQDRPAQFAAIRTDLDLNPIGDPINWLCQPTPELVPSPDACLITGLTPQHCAAEGLPEPEFARRILSAMSQPRTCSAGYNSIRFDDEVCRFLFFRNLLPVYDREWRDGNSRWDILDVARLAYALRPEGINWPSREDGAPSFRLETLSAANGLQHDKAHDALSDVEATIALARLIRTRQPKLFDWALQCRDKAFVKSQVPVLQQQPFVHVSGMLPASHGCLSVLVPLCFHPANRNEIICFDLQSDPAELAGLSATDIRHRLFSPAETLGDTPRLGIKSIHANKCPMVGPISLFTDEVATRLGLDRARMEYHATRLPDMKALLPQLQEAMAREAQPMDAEQALYQGFISDRDQTACRQFHGTPASQWLQMEEPSDQRLQTVWRRFIARHYERESGQPLPPERQADWQRYLRAALTRPEVGCALTLEQATARCRELRAEQPQNPVLDEVEAFLSQQQKMLYTTERISADHDSGVPNDHNPRG
ncbi:exodeoxyribonuclease I [Natronospirillum operosum]|uniref:Exodeoxyribonuclease I n=1 Tax=Natronospirillum operosum TaxID=2759953 RepID=A0A4Z0W7I2_9GAMM|nr:exodeoxyribonuclease I [Natronospirillum operosum]TGG92552.1 exodeoxyribonuclease I [Natronospirillum operosum]